MTRCGVCVDRSLTWIGLNKRLSFFILLSFSLLISTIALAATNGNLRREINHLRQHTSTAQPTTTEPTTDTSAPDTPAPDTPAPDTPAPDTPAPDTPAPDPLVPDAQDTPALDTLEGEIVLPRARRYIIKRPN